MGHLSIHLIGRCLLWASSYPKGHNLKPASIFVLFLRFLSIYQYLCEIVWSQALILEIGEITTRPGYVKMGKNVPEWELIPIFDLNSP